MTLMTYKTLVCDAEAMGLPVCPEESDAECNAQELRKTLRGEWKRVEFVAEGS